MYSLKYCYALLLTDTVANGLVAGGAARWRGSSVPSPWLSVPIVAIVALAFLPLPYVRWQVASVGWAGPAALLLRPFAANLLLDKATLAVTAARW